ncbi:hypothetical protein EV360DRAFT_86300 [Lentinula raphanica]|nr:hypothetical protein EV360DRAFT_86300 [Lentinula raphanica]
MQKFLTLLGNLIVDRFFMQRRFEECYPSAKFLRRRNEILSSTHADFTRRISRGVSIANSSIRAGVCSPYFIADQRNPVLQPSVIPLSTVDPGAMFNPYCPVNVNPAKLHACGFSIKQFPGSTSSISEFPSFTLGNTSAAGMNSLRSSRQRLRVRGSISPYMSISARSSNEMEMGLATAPSSIASNMDEIANLIDIKSWRKNDRDEIIQKFNVSAIPMKHNGSRPLLHWRAAGIYTSNDSGTLVSTVFDTYHPESDDSTDVKIDVYSRKYARSNAAAYFWEADLLREFTTTDLVQLLVAKKFHKYRYNGAGSGCRFWVTTLVTLLEQESIVSPGSTESLSQLVEEASADLRYWVPDESGAEFFDDD